MTGQLEEVARPVRLARSAAVNLEFVAICGIVLAAVAAFVGAGTGIVLMAISRDKVPGAVIVGASVLGWPIASLPAYAGLALARLLRLHTDSEPVR